MLFTHLLYCVSLQAVGVSDMLSKCKSIRAFQLYLNEGPESLTALSSCLEGVCHSSSIESVSQLSGCRSVVSSTGSLVVWVQFGARLPWH